MRFRQKATQPKAQETRRQHVILQKRNDTDLRGHPTDHQQLQDKAMDAGEHESGVAKTSQCIERKIKRGRPMLECLPPSALWAFPNES